MNVTIDGKDSRVSARMVGAGFACMRDKDKLVRIGGVSWDVSNAAKRRIEDTILSLRTIIHGNYLPFLDLENGDIVFLSPDEKVTFCDSNVVLKPRK